MSGAEFLLDGFSNDIISLQMIWICQRVRLKEGFWIFPRHLNFFLSSLGMPLYGFDYYRCSFNYVWQQI